MRVFVLILALLCLGGCLSSHDYSNRPDAWGGFERGRVYVLQQPVYVVHLKGGFPYPKAVSQADEQGYLVAHPKIQGVVEPGTRMRATKVMYVETMNYSEYDVIMTILDGPWAKRLVDVEPISLGLWRPQSPNSRYLELQSPK